eukprot:3936920-Rhodomonas_salina.1
MLASAMRARRNVHNLCAGPVASLPSLRTSTHPTPSFPQNDSACATMLLPGGLAEEGSHADVPRPAQLRRHGDWR